ncbi:MAG TPA: 16S rRNA (uracil(1498)-N(3))-methyltransferase [Defluviitaleaceae bacterium]|nr:16S rRNA (uracil(1498)-N(3))-methyltransferase [Candidatus Epulonipiscium sp.]HOQ17328.1 16S rRNA (uracil(1498)-N(3))-methyltransferase [Defluviitaleaceae bacterium]HQD51227.1 16S rRNA (uracil(1498)-N(3))-methyltransferase [Defluviitaleaceae bacterium]
MLPRFFVSPSQIQGKQIVIQGEDVKHISKVLRLKKGDKILICNRQGIDYECIIKDMEKIITAEIISKNASIGEALTKITLFQALTKSDKMDYIIQKAVELGVHRIVPVVTERTIVKIENEKKENSKLQRWNKISESAAKQSQRGIIPEVAAVIPLIEAFNQAEKMDLKLIPYEMEKNNHLKDLLANCTAKSIAIFIGPEGGFEESEINLAKEHGIIPVTLGRRILRTETAGLVTVSIMMYEMGEM